MSLFRVTLKRAAPLGLIAVSAQNYTNASQAASDDKGSNLPELPDLSKLTESIKNFDISTINFDSAMPVATTTSFGCLSGYACGTVVGYLTCLTSLQTLRPYDHLEIPYSVCFESHRNLFDR